MCDTLVVVEPNRVLFAKNSDRDPNEGQALEWHPRRESPEGAQVQCTYIAIPEVRQTYATMLSRPHWMWGAEMGANEHGVTIGNEAVFTKQPYAKDPALLGMDLLRLALERSINAKEACATLTQLLETYGQGGGCGFENRKFTYHNSFIVADPTEAFILETAGTKWAIEGVKGVRSISNGLTIPEFADLYSDRIKTHFSGCRTRASRTAHLGNEARSVGDMIAILRDYGEGNDEPVYHWTHGGLHAPCVHAGGVLANSQTTASLVGELTADGCQYWATATAAPDTGIFKPVRVDEPVDLGPTPTGKYDGSLWWRHEKLHRAVIRNPRKLLQLYRDERDVVEAGWLASPPPSAQAFAESDRLLLKWTELVLREDVPDVRPPWTRKYWTKRNAWAGLELEPGKIRVTTPAEGSAV